MEFHPANKSYQNVSLKGFRTFIKIKENENENSIYEPFADLDENISTKMTIDIDSLKIEEKNTELGLKTTVNYYILPNE
ncbi:hypothetical protein ACMYLR_23080, partial [Salmonella enterica subsp. enterica serovar Enteritidis]|uniref:hypothetical protein n=1 Tax=Salmonella enterica TaxID=28901 RepID=UPI0039ED1D6A